MYFILYSNNKSIWYVLGYIKTIPRPQESYRVRAPVSEIPGSTSALDANWAPPGPFRRIHSSVLVNCKKK